jgi:hypothetical protein
MATIHSLWKDLLKSFLLSCLIILFSLPGISQTADLPLNDQGKVAYFKSIKTDSLEYLTLWENATKYLNTLSVPDQLKKETQANEDLTELLHQFGFYLFVKPTLTKQIDGVLMADIKIKIINSEYAYTIDNFRFIKYARDRFGKFVPKSSKKYPLELYYPDNKKKAWNTHFEEISSKMQNITKILEEKMTDIRNFN